MTAAQVLQNYNAGVGQRYYMLFNVSGITGVSQSYVMFTVSQYDSYGYLFYQPTFISLDSVGQAEQHPHRRACASASTARFRRWGRPICR